jgi:Squalene-hopene cyclase C-terminal domain
MRVSSNTIRPLATCVMAGLLLLAARSGRGGSEPDLKPPTPRELENSIERGVRFLLETQNTNGSWGSAQKTKDLNIYAPVPGAHHAFRAGVSALAIMALIETGAADHDEKAKQALEKGQAWLLEQLPHLRRANPTAIYNVWGHAYGIQALAALYRRATNNPARQKTIRRIIEQQIRLLREYESVDGGWGYYDFAIGAKHPATASTSFVTATVLVAFHEAAELGIEIPPTLLGRALTSLRRQQKNDFSYLYSETQQYRPMNGINRPGGSLGRSQACNIALRYWGDTNITKQVLTTWLERLVTRNGWLSMGRKRPVPHESWFQVAGYFYYYGHYYASLCLQELDAATAAPFQGDLAAILLPLQEKDGSWWDFPLYNYHQAYGTSFALMCLARCRK